MGCVLMIYGWPYRDIRPIPLDGVILEPPRLSFCNSWDQWMNEMERPNAYADQFLRRGCHMCMEYVFGYYMMAFLSQ